MIKLHLVYSLWKIFLNMSPKRLEYKFYWHAVLTMNGLKSYLIKIEACEISSRRLQPILKYHPAQNMYNWYLHCWYNRENINIANKTEKKWPIIFDIVNTDAKDLRQILIPRFWNLLQFSRSWFWLFHKMRHLSCGSLTR